MQNFIVLGIIPGTNIQTTFTFWVAVAAILVAIPLLVGAWRRRYAVIAYIIAIRVAWLIDRHQLQA